MLLIGAGLAGSQLRPAAERVAGIQPGERHLDAARRERPPVSEPRGGRRVLSPVRRQDRARSWREGARRRLGRCRSRRRSAGAASTSRVRRRSPDRSCRSISAARRPDYFRTMEIPLVQGPLLHRRRHAAERAAGRHHRREVRAALLAERRCDRQAPLERSQAAHDDRRRRRHGEAVRPRHRRPHRRLSAVAGTAAVSGRADVVGSGGRRRRDRARDSTRSIRRSRCSTSAR